MKLKVASPVVAAYRAAPPNEDPESSWLRRLYDEERNRVFRYAASRVGRDRAADIVADTFVEAAHSRQNYDPGRGTESAWLLGIATNVIRRARRRDADATALAPLTEEQGGELDPAVVDLPHRLDDRRRAGLIRQAVADLPDGEKEAFLLYAVEELTTREVAEILAISPAAAKLRIFRARRRLRNTLNKFEEENLS